MNGCPLMSKFNGFAKLVVTLIFLSNCNVGFAAEKKNLECRPNEGTISCEDRKRIGDTLEDFPEFFINQMIRVCLFKSGYGYLGVKTKSVTGVYRGVSNGGWHMAGMISFNRRQYLPGELTPFVLENRNIIMQGFSNIPCNF